MTSNPDFALKWRTIPSQWKEQPVCKAPGVPVSLFLISSESHSSVSQVGGPPTPSDQRNVASYRQEQLATAPTGPSFGSAV